MSRRNPSAAKGLALAAAAAAVVALVVGLVLVPGGSGAPAGRGPGSPSSPAASVPVQVTAPPPVTQAAPDGPPPSVIATLTAATAYSATPGGAPVGTLPARNPFGTPEVLAVTGSDTQGLVTWLHVELPIRPNGSTGWIRAAGVSLAQTSYRVSVSLSRRILTVSDAGHVVLTTPVAVGQASTPTPPGSTYLWELVRPDDPNGAYGPYIFGLAWYSDAYTVFNGGDAQIGIHGQDEPWSIGYAASNGCVRLPNEVIVKLAGMLPLGTPVDIS